jgi:cytochrome c oxidase accessory protein FixG
MAGGQPAPRRQRPRLPDLETPFTINPDGSRNFLHPADVRGRWQTRKNVVYGLLIAIYLGLPWLRVDGRPAFLIDIPRRQAFLFGGTFTAEDFWLLFFVLSGAGFALIVLTSLWGRVWCGFACPQTVFLEGVFRRIERWLEGPRETRLRRNRGPLTAEVFARKGVKHLLWIVLCLLLAHTFLAYFVPVGELARWMRGSPAAHWTAFAWALAMAALLYFDFSWFREQTCLVVCPYGRFQSALIDEDSIVIGYDVGRGEPRSKVNEEGGDCIDCRRCVAVCPTGIDIRNGLQMECVGCSNCVDACDEVMDRLGWDRGLIRYDSKHGFAGARRRFLRPRVVLYTILGAVGLAVAVVSITGRTPFEVRALRTRGMPYAIEDNTIRNLFNLRVENKRPDEHAFALSVAPAAPGQPPVRVVIAQPEITLPAMSDTTVPVFAIVALDDYHAPFTIAVAVTEQATQRQQRVELQFIGP